VAGFEFRCSECREVRDVTTLQKSVCEDCRRLIARRDEAKRLATTTARDRYEARLASSPVYMGEENCWTPGEPVLLPDRQHFICPSCKDKRHIVEGIRHICDKRPYFIPNADTVCDVCFREDAERIQVERGRRAAARRGRAG